MRTGRPTKYKPEMCQQAQEFMAQGYSKEAAAAHLGVHRDTFFDWAKNKPDFSDAIKRAEDLNQLWWEKTGMAGMLGKLPGFNAATWIFNMKNRHGWRDKHELAGAGPGGEHVIRLIASDTEVL